MSGNKNYSRIMKFRNPRAAKMFAELHGGIYKGWIDETTTFTIKRDKHGVKGPLSVNDKGCYVVVWE